MNTSEPDANRANSQRPRWGWLAWEATVGYIAQQYSPDAMLTLQIYPMTHIVGWAAALSWKNYQESVEDQHSFPEVLNSLWTQVSHRHSLFHTEETAIKAPVDYDEDSWLDEQTYGTFSRLVNVTDTVLQGNWRIIITYRLSADPKTRLQARLLAKNKNFYRAGSGATLREVCRNLYHNSAPILQTHVKANRNPGSEGNSMAVLDRSIFRKYDIRGVATGDEPQLTPGVARLVGQALGTYLPDQFDTEHVFVGSDNRPTSPALRAALIEGLTSTGMDVTDIGEVMTPTVYFASASYDGTGAGVMITGSHLTTKYNGIKMAYGKLALAGEQIQDLLRLIERGEFTNGEGNVSEDLNMIYKHMETITDKVSIDRKLKVVLDAGNGLSGTYVPPVLENLGLEVICLYCEPDGTFPNHLPNPEDPEMTKDLEAKVIETGADLGLAFDGDSDRCGFIDEHGHHIAADKLLAVLARDMLSRHPGNPVVFDVKASQALPNEIKKYGGKPVMWKSGHSLMKQKMNEIGSLLGGEVSGHLFIGEEYYGFDDAPLVALKALSIFAKSDQSVSEIFDEFPKLVATPEIILSAPDDVKFKIIEEITAALDKNHEVVTVDGARAIFENGWGLVRASNTQPAVTLRFEAETKADVAQYMSLFKTQLDKYESIDQSKFNEQYERFSN